MVAGANAESIPLGAYVPRLGGTTATAAALPFFNVKDYGAVGDGVTDNTAAITAAVNAANVNGGTVWFPPGVYIWNALSWSGGSALTNVTFAGCGESSILRHKTGNSSGLVMYGATGVTIQDLVFDQNSQAATSITFDVAGTRLAVRRCYFPNCSGGAIFTANAAGGAFNANSRATDMIFEDNHVTVLSGNSRDVIVMVAAGGRISGNYVSMQGGNGIVCYESNQVVVEANQVDLSGVGGFGICLSSSTGCVVKGNTVYGYTADACYKISKETDNGGSARNQTDALFVGNFAGLTPGQSNAPVGYELINASNTVILGGICNQTHDVIFIPSGTSTGLLVEGVQAISLAATFTENSGTLTGQVYRNNPGYNPVGSESPAVPASGTPVAAADHDRTYYVTTVAGTTTCSMAIQNGPTVTFLGAVAQVIAVRVPAGKTVTPTYTGTAPTWVVEGE